METLAYDNLNLKTKINRNDWGEYQLQIHFNQTTSTDCRAITGTTYDNGKLKKTRVAKEVGSSPEVEIRSDLHTFLAACYNICKDTFSRFSKKDSTLFGNMNHVLSLILTDERGCYIEGILDQINENLSHYTSEFERYCQEHFNHVYRKLQHRNGCASGYYNIAV